MYRTQSLTKRCVLNVHCDAGAGSSWVVTLKSTAARMTKHPRCSSCNCLLAGKQTLGPVGAKVCKQCYNKEHPPNSVATVAPGAVPPLAETSASASPVVMLRPTRKRRAESDPGELTALQTRSRSAAAALLGLAKSAKGSRPSPSLPVPEEVSSSASSTQRFLAARTAEQAEVAARTPAQLARREYLMSVAPRCERCNFPRTGRKGWDEKKGCHQDKNCNLYPWRVIDAFC